MAEWQDYMVDKTTDEHTVVGTVRRLADVYSPQLNNSRDIFVYLPPSYHETDKRYPVIYMHDGQNLFDDALSFAGEWHVDATLEALSTEGIEAIVVGISNIADTRILEFNPFDSDRFGRGTGDLYLEFLLYTLKPLIDTDFRTLPQRECTGIAGSSLGGLISLYAFFSRPQFFGFTAVLSPSLFMSKGAILSYVANVPYVSGKIYLDMGTEEAGKPRGTNHNPSLRMVELTRRMRDVLVDRGYRLDKNLKYVEDEGGIHNEAEWAKRFPDAVRFLLGEE